MSNNLGRSIEAKVRRSLMSDNLNISVDGMIHNYWSAITFYDRFSSAKRRSEERNIEAAASLKKRLTVDGREAARVIGAQKWTTSQAAKDNVDDQKFAERKALLHAAVAQTELLRNIEDLLIGIHNMLLEMKSK
jgi:hypothetical protein